MSGNEWDSLRVFSTSLAVLIRYPVRESAPWLFTVSEACPFDRVRCLGGAKFERPCGTQASRRGAATDALPGHSGPGPRRATALFRPGATIERFLAPNRSP